jgi:hypothetical protein
MLLDMFGNDFQRLATPKSPVYKSMTPASFGVIPPLKTIKKTRELTRRFTGFYPVGILSPYPPLSTHNGERIYNTNFLEIFFKNAFLPGYCGWILTV